MNQVAPREAALPATSPAVARQSGLLDRIPIVGMLVALPVIAITFLVIYPLVRLVLSLILVDGQLTLDSVTQTITMPGLSPALANTVILVLTAGPAALLVGSVFAWLNERTDARLGWAADVLPIIPLLIPPLATAIGRVVLLAPQAGFLNALFRWIFEPNADVSATGPLDIYSMIGMICITAVVTAPQAYLIVSAALRNVDPALEEASLVFGETPFGTLRKVTLPAIRNALATAAVLVVITTVSIFSVPVTTGGQRNIEVLSMLMFRTVNAGGIPRFDLAIVLSVFMLAIVQIAMLVERGITRSGHHATIGGKARAHVRLSLGVWRVPARIAMLLYLSAVAVLPMLGLVLVSLQDFWTPQIDWSKLSFANYASAFGVRSGLGQAFANSLVLGIATATVMVVVCPVIACYVANSTGRIARLVDALTGLPASVPHVVTGVAFLIALGSGRYSLSGTLVLLFLVYFVVTLPQASRSASVALSQVGKELWEGSLMCGASWVRTFLRVLLPLMLPGLIAGWAIVFAHAFSEISASVFLSSPARNPVSGPAIVDAFLNNGTFPQLAALAVCVTLLQTAVVLVVQIAGRRRLSYQV